MGTTASDLAQYLKQHPPARQFVPYCHLNRDSDALTVYFFGDADYSERLSDHVTLYRSLETHELVGCRIKGILGLLEDLPNFVEVNHRGIRLSVIFFAFRGGAEENERRAINDLARVAVEQDLAIQDV